MTSRSLTIAVSALVLLAVAGVAAIAVAFMGGGEAQSEKPVVVASPQVTLTPAAVTPTPGPEAPATATLTPEPPAPGTPRAPTPTTIGAAFKPTFTPTVFGAQPSPTPKPKTPEPSGPGPSGPGPSGPGPSEPPPTALPDLVVLDLSVYGDRVVAVIGNLGEQAIPAGTPIELALGSEVAASGTLPQSLDPGGNFTLLLAQEFVYGPESVAATVDPRNLVKEVEETNNGLTRQLGPDVPLDLALTGLNAVGGDSHLSVNVENKSVAPVRQVTARLSVYRSDVSSPLSTTIQQLDIDPQTTIELAPGLSAVRGLTLRATLELVGITDGDPANNTLEILIP